MTWNETSPDALPYERLTEGDPTATLNGGRDGLTPILALMAQSVITGLRADTAAVAADLATLDTFAHRVEVLDELSPGGGQQAASTFSGLSAEFRAFLLLWHGRHDGATNTFVRLGMRFNGDSGANYTRMILRTATDSGTFTPEPSVLPTGTFTTAHGGSIGTQFGGGLVVVHQATAGIVPVNGIGLAGRGGVENVSVYVAGSMWNNASTITSIAAWPGVDSWTADARLTLLGIRS